MGKSSRISVLILLLTGSGIACSYDIEDLQAMAERKNLTSVEAVIENLPPDLLANYTLAYSSQSLQSASFDNPRAILFGRDAKFVVTFNGNPSQTYYNELEILQFNGAKNDFELYRLAFSSAGITVEKNPQICLSCHGASPRPIWGSYEYGTSDDNHWPGFYGSSHDVPANVPEEQIALEKFKKSAAQHPRYKNLKLHHPDSKPYPYDIGPYQHRFRPNNRIGNLLARLYAKKVAAHLITQPQFQQQQEMAMLGILDCPQAMGDRYKEELTEMLRERYSETKSPKVYRELTGVAEENRRWFLLEKIYSGLDIYTWNMSMTTLPRGKRYFTGIATIDQLVAASLLEQLSDESWWKPYYAPLTNESLYDSFAVNYYARNVAPGGVGQTYDRLGLFFDSTVAQKACYKLAETIGK